MNKSSTVATPSKRRLANFKPVKDFVEGESPSPDVPPAPVPPVSPKAEWLPVSWRIARETARRLVVFAAERKANGSAPWTQQEIVNAALLEYIDRHV